MTQNSFLNCDIRLHLWLPFFTFRALVICALIVITAQQGILLFTSLRKVERFTVSIEGLSEDGQESRKLQLSMRSFLSS